MDTAGQSTFHQGSYGATFWSDISAVVAVFDVGNRESFKALAKWLPRVQDASPGKSLQGALVANKVELAESGRRVIDKDEGEDFASKCRLQYFEVSVEENRGVEAPFRHLAAKFAQRYANLMSSVEEEL